MWITAEEKNNSEKVHLHLAANSDGAKYRNEWSEYPKLGPDFPVFENPDKRWVKTSITVPLRHGASNAADEGHVFGLISLHSEDYKECTGPARELYAKLARAIGAVLSAYENYQRKKDSARAALKKLEEEKMIKQFFNKHILQVLPDGIVKAEELKVKYLR